MSIRYLLHKTCLLVIGLALMCCQGYVSDSALDDGGGGTLKLAVGGDPSVTIVVPSNYSDYPTTKAGNPNHPQVDVTVKVEVSDWTFPGADRQVRLFIDGVLEATVDDLDEVVIYGVDKGQHTLSAALFQKVGGVWTMLGNGESVHSVIIRVRIVDNCHEGVWSATAGSYVCNPDQPAYECCIDGNPCSVDSCVLSQGVYQCKYGQTGGGDCCVSDFDCDGTTECYLGDTEAFKNHCIECTGDDGGCDDGDPCTADSCGDDWMCVHASIYPGCCTSDVSCADLDPCTIDYCEIGYAEVTGSCKNVGYQEKWDDADFWVEQNLVKEAYAGCCVSEKVFEYCDAHHIFVGGEIVQDICWNVACLGNKCRYGHVSDPLCCNTAAECEDEICVKDKWTGVVSCETNVCTYDYCIDNHCTFEPNPFPPIGSGSITGSLSCCTELKDCDDGDPSTIDWCDNYTCKHKDNPLYCDLESDPAYVCEPSENPCINIICSEHVCTTKAKKDCCIDDWDCGDGDACTTDVCELSSNTCIHEAIEYIAGKQCCNNSVECQDELFCTLNQCIANRCRTGKVKYDASECTSQICCQDNTDANGDGEADGCADTNPCTKNACEGHCCIEKIIDETPEGSSCCLTSLDCPEDPYKVYKCINNECHLMPAIYCDETHPNCGDGNACTNDSCNYSKGICTYSTIPACCLEDYDCMPETPDPCKKYKCNKVMNPAQCEVFNVSNCCEGDEECDDSDPCTADACVNKECRHTLIDPDCCVSVGDCDDDNVCTTDSCDGGVCKHDVKDEEGCCTTDGMCEDDDPCTKDLCTSKNKCDHKLVSECCEEEGENPVECGDKNPCTADWCLFGKCRHFTPDKAPYPSDIPPGCCVSTADCDDDENVCTDMDCVQGLCLYQPKDPCILDLPYFQDFNHYVTIKDGGGMPVVGFVNYIQYLGWNLEDHGSGDTYLNWKYSTEGPLGLDWHVSFDGVTAPTSSFNSYLLTPAFRLRGPDGGLLYTAVTVQWDNHLNLSLDVSTDLTVYAIDGDDLAGAADVWAKTAIGDMDVSQQYGISTKSSVDLSGYGDLIRIAFNISELQGSSAHINGWDLDNVRICAGRPPSFQDAPDAIGALYNTAKVVKLGAVDPDEDTLSFKLINAPDFIHLDTLSYDFNTGKYTVNLNIDADGDETLASGWEMKLRVSDGCLYVEQPLTVYVLFGEGYLVWAPEEVSPQHGEAIKDAILGQPDQVSKQRKVQIISDLSIYPDLTVLDGIFVTAGIAGRKHVFDTVDADSASLYVYLSNGGRVYLEGGDSWCLDPPQPLFDAFRIQCVFGGPAKAGVEITGANFFHSLDPAYSQTPYNPSNPDEYWNNFPDEIELSYEKDGKFPRITQYDGGAAVSVAFEKVLEEDQDGDAVLEYRTYGTSLPFGGYTDGAQGLEVMGRVLDFFENGYPPCTADVQCIDGQECTVDQCAGGACEITFIENCEPCIDDRDCDAAYNDESHACKTNLICTPLPGDHFLSDSGNSNKLLMKLQPKVTSVITVADSGNVYNLNLKVRITHKYRGDLKITLSHSGKEVLIKDADPSDSALDYYFTFDAGHPAAGGSMNLFDGLGMTGDWVLTVEDVKPNNFKDGKLVSWSLFIVSEGEECVEDEDCVDANQCTSDSCVDDYCVHSLVDCTDYKNNVPDLCTSEICDPDVGCVYTATDCSDDSPCSIDSCDPASGLCSHVWPPSCGGECTVHADCGLYEYCGVSEMGKQECLAIGGLVYHSNLLGPLKITDDDDIGITNGQALLDNPRKAASVVIKVYTDHPAIGDLQLILKKDSTEITLHDQTGGSADGHVWVFGVDPKYDAVSGPGSLSELIGGAMKGDWLLTVKDKKFGNVGTLNNWLLFTVETECFNTVDCDDGDTCTSDACVVNPDPDMVDKILKLCGNSVAIECNDGDFCNGTETCNYLLGCVPGVPPVVDDDVDCTDDMCSKDDQKVYHLPNNTYCDDGNPCTDDVCDPAQGCVNAPNSDLCDDGVYCTTDDVCTSGVCKGTVDDTIPGCACTQSYDCPNQANGDKCAGAYQCVDGACVINPSTVVTCDTSLDTECLKNVCDADDGECKMLFIDAGVICDDGAPCTYNDACDGGGKCIGTGKACDDGNWCNGTETCNPDTGVCEDNDAPPVDDNIACTVDICDPEKKTINHVPDDTLCDDDQYCNGLESCNPSSGCQNGTAVACNDFDPCTIDVCDTDLAEGKGACDYTGKVEHCDWPCDGAHDYDAGDNVCGWGDACVGGAGDSTGHCTPICSGAGCIEVKAEKLGLSIPDNTGECLEYKVDIATGFKYVKDVFAKVGVKHSAVFDLTASLIDPEGTTVVMWKNFGGDNDDYYNTFDLSYPDTYELMCSFRGDNPAGEWTLKICDTYPNNSGVLDYFYLFVRGTDGDTSPGDRCDNALFLNSSDGDHILTGNTGCYQDDYDGGCGDAGKDLVYMFVLDKAKMLTADIGGAVDWVLFVKGAEGDGCGAAVTSCANSCGDDTCGEHIMTKLQPGKHFLVVDSASGYGSFQMTVSFQSLLDDGQLCDDANDCISDDCVDGVCCDGPCTGLCKRCDGLSTVGGVAGECDFLKDNIDPENECAGADSICGGVCNGLGDCKYAALTVPQGACRQCDGKGGWQYVTVGQDPFDDCQDRYCNGSTVFYEQRCDGAGACKCHDDEYQVYTCDSSTDNQSCPEGYTCDPDIDLNGDGLWDDCRESCSDQVHCQDDWFCDLLDDGVEALNSCVPKYELGEICHETVSYECKDNTLGSAYPCVDGVCCHNTCSGLCKACDVAGSKGACTPLPDDFVADEECKQLCEAGELSSFGHVTNCCSDGRCGGSGSCVYPAAGVECHGQSCGVNNNDEVDDGWDDNLLFTADTCDGSGFCVDNGYGECPGGFSCDGDKEACLANCTADVHCWSPNVTDCAAGGGVNYICKYGTCIPNVCGNISDIPLGSVKGVSTSSEGHLNTAMEPVGDSQCVGSCASGVARQRSGFYPVLRVKDSL